MSIAPYRDSYHRLYPHADPVHYLVLCMANDENNEAWDLEADAFKDIHLYLWPGEYASLRRAAKQMLEDPSC